MVIFTVLLLITGYMFFKAKVLCRVELSRLSCLPFSDPSLDQEFGGQKLIEALMWVFVASTYSAAACCVGVSPLLTVTLT